MLLWIVVSAPWAWAMHLDAAEVETAMRAALSEMNMKASLVAGSVRFPNAPVLVKGAHLVADRATITPPNRMEALVRCRPVYACLPFHASAEVRPDQALGARFWNKESEARRSSVPKIRPGERVTYVDRTIGIQTSVQAVLLDAAVVGQMVRVRALDGKHEILRGRLCAEHVVRSES
jgi:hypothetical protein